MRPLADLVYAACNSPVHNLVGAPGPDGRRKLAADLKPKLRTSRRFYVTDEVTAAATTLGVEHPDILAEMLRRARLPFHTCWVEWDNQTAYAIANHGLALHADSPARVGCLIERLHETVPHYRMLIFAGDYPQRGAPLVSMASMMIEYRLDQPIQPPAVPAGYPSLGTLAQLPDSYIRQCLIGSAYIDRGDKQREADEIAHRIALCDRLASHAVLALTPYARPSLDRLAQASASQRAEIATTLRTDLLENAGVWRFVISLLALINARDYVAAEATFRQGNSRMAGGHRVPYLEHRVVSLKLPRAIVEARVRRALAEAIPRRRHEVIGHWKQNRHKGLPGCAHVYVDETPTREVCVVEGCGHKRWWVDEFTRGDATIGYVLKDRVITRD